MENVRMWSEKVFSMINDGRLKTAWSDRYAIKDIQRDTYKIGTRLNSNKAEKRSDQNNSNNWFHREINEEHDGRPCIPWNKGGKLWIQYVTWCSA